MAECHCGKDGHALNSVNCPVHAPLRAEFLDHGAAIGIGYKGRAVRFKTPPELLKLYDARG